MIVGLVDPDGIPFIAVQVGGDVYRAVVDTGFNGDLELPEELREHVHPTPIGTRWANLASGQRHLDEMFLVEFPFDGENVNVEASFVQDVEEILIGTGLLAQYRLEVDFPQSKLVLKKVAEGNGSP